MLQIIFEFLYQFLVEILCYGTGRGLITLTGTNADRHETLCSVIGLMFWALLGISIWWFFSLLLVQIQCRLLKTVSSKAARSADPEAYAGRVR